MKCPFCENEIIPESYGQGMRKYYSYRCMHISCTINELPRWMIGKTYDGEYTIFYKAVMPYKNKLYSVEGKAKTWTRLYYNEPDLGALSQSPIIEIPEMLTLTEPYLECIQKHLDRLTGLLSFI